MPRASHCLKSLLKSVGVALFLVCVILSGKQVPSQIVATTLEGNISSNISVVANNSTTATSGQCKNRVSKIGFLKTHKCASTTVQVT